ncbi:MAG: hypothetical protein II179_03235 [Alphaproteobacteria bacterium]|nr:hypothetical protein [Alphaproteobacteria bacterium]
MAYNFYTENAYLSKLAFLGKAIPDAYNPLVQKGRTYDILSDKYAEKKAKYDNATPAYKGTEEYDRLGQIVVRLRETLKRMEADMAR